MFHTNAKRMLYSTLFLLALSFLSQVNARVLGGNGFDIGSELTKNGLITAELRLQDKSGVSTGSTNQVAPEQLRVNTTEPTNSPLEQINVVSPNESGDAESTFDDHQQERAIELDALQNELTELQPYERSKRARSGKGKPLYSPFPSQPSANKHHQKHQSEYGGCSFGIYCKNAASLNRQSTPHTYRRPNGETVKYFPATNDFIVTNSNNKVLTLFKPSGGLTYFQRDQSRYGR